MRIVMTLPPSANLRDQWRQIALSLGLVCEATDCVAYDDLAIRLAQEPPADLVLVCVADDTAAALVAIHEALRTSAPILAAGPAVEPEQVLPLTRAGARAYLDQAQLRDELNRVLDQLVKRGRIARGYLGVGMQPVTFPEGTVQSLGLSNDRGLLVIAVASGSSAEKGGILLGDIIVAVDASPIANVESLQPFLDSENVGKTIALVVVRGGQMLKLPVVVGEKPRS